MALVAVLQRVGRGGGFSLCLMKASMRLKISVWPWVAALVLLWVWGLGQAPLFDVDEGAFAEASREMLTSGD